MSWLNTTTIEKPSSMPITVEQLRAYMRIDNDTEDDVLLGFLRASVARVDGVQGIGYAMMRQKWQTKFQRFPANGSCLPLPGYPIKSIDSLSYYDIQGNQVQTDDITSLGCVAILDEEPAKLCKTDGNWPEVNYDDPMNWQVRPVVVQYSLGETEPDDVEPDVVLAVKMLAARWYENREGSLPMTESMREIPVGVMALLNMHSRRIPST